MAEHVGIRRFRAFLRQVYEALDDNGIFYLQIAGLREQWQYEVCQLYCRVWTPVLSVLCV